MKQASKPLVLVFAILLIFVIAGLPVGAQNVPESNSTNAAVPGGPGFIMVHPFAFNPLDMAYEWDNGVGGFLFNPGAEQAYYGASVNLPHGAVITKFVVYYYDSANINLFAQLIRLNLDNDQYTVLSEFVSSGIAWENRVGEVGLFSTVDPVVDNQSNAYRVEFGLPGGVDSTLGIRGIRIDYSYPVNLPMINK